MEAAPAAAFSSERNFKHGRDNHPFGDQEGLLSAKLWCLKLLEAEFACCHFEMAGKKKRNPQFPVRFKEDFGGEEDIRPAAKEDVTGTSRIPRGRILLVLGENFKIVSVTSNPDVSA